MRRLLLVLLLAAGLLAGKLVFGPDGNETERNDQTTAVSMDNIIGKSEPEATEKAENEAVTETESKQLPDEITLLKSEPNLDGYSLLSCDHGIKSCYESYSLDRTIPYQQESDNSPKNMFDDDEYTCWWKDDRHYGSAEGFTVVFDGDYEIRYLGFKLGEWKPNRPEFYTENAKPKTMTISFDSFHDSVTFPDEKKVAWIEFDHPAVTDSLDFVIEDHYSGTMWDNITITDILVYGIRK